MNASKPTVMKEKKDKVLGA